MTMILILNLLIGRLKNESFVGSFFEASFRNCEGFVSSLLWRFLGAYLKDIKVFSSSYENLTLSVFFQEMFNFPDV